MENRVKFKIGEIEFEAEGSVELIEREREIFLSTLLPAAVDAIKNTHGVEYQKQFIESSESTPLLQPVTDMQEGGLDERMDFSRTSLASFVSKFGSLSEQDFVLFAAYYEEMKAGKQVPFSKHSVISYYENARRTKYSNNSELLRQLAIKGFIMDAPDAEKKGPKFYILTTKGIDYLKAYQPKQGETKKVSPRSKKVRIKMKSIYENIDVDTLKLEKYPSIKSLKDFKEKMMMVLYIVTQESNEGGWFTTADVLYLLTDVFGESATADQVNGVFTREKLWFKPEKDKTGVRRKLLNGGLDYANSLLLKQAE